MLFAHFPFRIEVTGSSCILLWSNCVRNDGWCPGVPLSNWKVTAVVDDEKKNREAGRKITWVQFQQHIINGGRPERTPAIDDTWWELITKCWDHGPQVRPSFAEMPRDHRIPTKFE